MLANQLHDSVATRKKLHTKVRKLDITCMWCRCCNKPWLDIHRVLVIVDSADVGVTRPATVMSDQFCNKEMKTDLLLLASVTQSARKNFFSLFFSMSKTDFCHTLQEPAAFIIVRCLIAKACILCGLEWNCLQSPSQPAHSYIKYSLETTVFYIRIRKKLLAAQIINQ